MQLNSLSYRTVRAAALPLTIFTLILCAACGSEEAAGPEPEPPKTGEIAREFIYPVGEDRSVTEARDSADIWFNAQDFGENRHLGEDWNKNTGGNSDCGEPVRAIADGVVTLASDAGPGWGNVVIVDHLLPDGTRVQSLYGHLQSIAAAKGRIRLGERIGTIGNAGGTYLCHLHFEIRDESCPLWGKPGPGYADDRDGWLDPSDFIDRMARSGRRR